MFFLFNVAPLVIVIPMGIYFYFFFKRVLEALHIDSQQRYIKIVLMAVAFLFVYPAHNVFHIWLVVVGHLFIFAVLCDLMMKIYQKKKQPQDLLFKIYQLGIVPIICTSLVIGYGYWKMKQVYIKQYTITTTKQLSRDYRIAFLSDLHFANTMNQNQLKQYCQEIEKAKVDMVILGGDIVDEQTTYQHMQEAFQTLGQIKSTYGTYYVYGNHDRALYASKPAYTKQQLQDVITLNGIQILSEHTFRLNNEFALVGREDSSQSRQSTQELIRDISSQDFILLIDHKPIAITENDDAFVDLQISGHTHGGQMFPIGFMIDTLGFGEMSYGYKSFHHLQLIVSSGIAGWGYPLRTGSQSEYVIVDIKSK